MICTKYKNRTKEREKDDNVSEWAKPKPKEEN